MRQGLLSEPKASSGPAAMLLAVSRSPSSIPRRSPCPERCHLPLVSLDHIPPPGPMPPSSGVPLHPSHKTSKASPTASTERCHLPLASLYTSTSQNPKNIPDCIHSRSDASFLWRPSTTSTSQDLKNIPDCIHSRSDASFLWRPSTTSTSQNLKNIHDCLHSRSDATFLSHPSTTST